VLVQNPAAIWRFCLDPNEGFDSLLRYFNAR
jgi:hypothetical protein